MDFFLFLLVNALLFIRPAEFLPSLYALPLYNIAIVANLIVAGPAVINYVINNGLSRCPTTACVFGVLFCIVLSHLARFDLWSARMGGLDFVKIVAYFLLLMVVINTPRRLFQFLAVIVLFTLIVNILAVLQYHGRIDIPALTVLMQSDYDEVTGQAFEIPRLRATGIFNDPNDLSMIIVASMIISAAGLFSSMLGMSRVLLLAPVGFLGYALTLTQSRGGLLALMAGACVFLFVRFGKVKAGLVAAVLVPLALIGFGGRQADFGNALSGGTGAERVELWSAGLQAFKQSPAFGIGYGRYAEDIGMVAHNSFVHAFVELGFFGGMMFLGAFGTVGWSLWKLRRHQYEFQSAELAYFLPYVIALLAAFAVSMMSLSRNYVVPTYLVIGAAAVYERMARQGTSVLPMVLSGRVLMTLVAAGIGFLAFIYCYIQVLHRL